MFVKKNKIKAGYVFSNEVEGSIIYNEFRHTVNRNEFGCPAMSGLNNRIYSLNPHLSCEVLFGLQGGKEFFEYKINDKDMLVNDSVHELIKNSIAVKKDNGIVNLQFNTNYVIITDKPDLEIIQLPAINNEIKSSNVEIVLGTYKPYSWARDLNCAFVLKDNSKLGKIIFNLNRPIFSVLFNYQVEFKFYNKNKKISDFINLSKTSNNYIKKTIKLFPKMLAKRPKNLLYWLNYF